MSAITSEEWRSSFGGTGWVHDDGTDCPEYLAPPASTPPGGYWCTTHQMFVRHPASPIILEVSKYDPDEDPQVIADSYQAELIPSSLPRRDRAFHIADEDVDFADEWDDEESSAYHDRVEAGLEGKDSSDE